MDSLLSQFRKRFHQKLLDTNLTVDKSGIPSIADKGQKSSIRFARGILERLGAFQQSPKGTGQSSGHNFEAICHAFLEAFTPHLAHLHGGTWEVYQVKSRRGIFISQYQQYAHLQELDHLARADELLATVLGHGYAISPDLVVLRHPEETIGINQSEKLIDGTIARLTPTRKDNNHLPFLHAIISGKWTIRNDRAQNARSEALTLIRNRKGRVPHIMVITAEPSPSRIASLALGTGDIDCVYHFALPELTESVSEEKNDEAITLLQTMVYGKRLRDIADLPLDLLI